MDDNDFKIEWDHAVEQGEAYQRTATEMQARKFREQFETSFPQSNDHRTQKVDYQEYKITELTRMVLTLEREKNARLMEDSREMALRTQNKSVNDAYEQYRLLLKLVS